MTGQISVKNQKDGVTTIDIEGVIGVPEDWQFEKPGQRIATYETFRSTVDSLKELKSSHIIVNIRSTGGNMNDALLIFDALSGLQAKVTTRCYGYVASAATVIAQAASDGCREISANSLYLVHKSLGSAEGNTNEIAKILDLLGQTDKRIASIYAAKSGRPEEDFTKLMCVNEGSGRWLSPEEVIECGLADRVIAGTSLPKNAEQIIMNMGLPPIPNNKICNKMNISKRWNAILEVLGLAGADEADSTKETQGVDYAEVELAKATIDSMASAQVQLREAHKKEVENLQNKIHGLEIQNARMAAAATTTQPKEDPSPQEMRRSPNEEAYYSDARRFM